MQTPFSAGGLIGRVSDTEGTLTDHETRVGTLEDATAYASILKATWADLLALSGSGDGQRAEVDVADTGTHLAASATGYDGASVENAGLYSWNATWSRWARIGDGSLTRVRENITDEMQLSLGDKIADTTASKNLANGATATSGTSYGITFPSGVTGSSSFIQLIWPFVGSGRAGDVIRLKVRVATSATFTRVLALTCQVRINGTSNVNRTAVVTQDVYSGETIFTVDYTLQGDETDLRPYILVSGSSPATASEETMEVTELRPAYLSGADRVRTAADDVLDELIPEQVLNVGGEAFLVTLGNKVDATVWVGQLFNGATWSGKTVTIPSGSSGQTTLIHFKMAFDGAANIGRRVRLTLAYDLSATFTRTFANPVFQVATAASPSGTSRVPASSVVTTDGTRRIHVIEFIVQGDETAILPYAQINSTGATASDETITLTDWVMQYLTTMSDVQNAQDEMLSARETLVMDQAWSPAAAYAGAQSGTQQSEATIAASGGDYATPNAAISAISDASAWNRYRLTVEPGIYEGGEFFDEDFVDFIGRDPAECRFRLFQADGTSAANIALYSTMYMLRNSRIHGLTVEAKNARYAIHLESGNGAPDRLQEIVGCEVLHWGNDDAPANTWTSQYALGAGLSSGVTVRARKTKFWGKNTGAFYYHTNVDFDHPTFVDVEGCELSTDVETGSAFAAVALGSFQKDQCRLVGNTFGGDIRYFVTPWLQTTLAKQPANHAEISIYGHGNSPAVFRITDFGRALRIDSATTGASSSVEISGDAVANIFGDGTSDRYFTRGGSAGFAGSVWGWGDVSDTAVGPAQDVQITSLGKRLGDCSGVSKTLTVTVDGGTPMDVTFDQDHTAQSNATIIGIINTALGAAATASLYTPGERYRPHFSDEEQSLKNGTGSGIPFGTVLAWDGSRQTVRPMTSADSAGLFAGVAWEDIEDGKRGRVKTSGYLALTDILRTDSAAVSFGDTFSIDAGTPGSITLGGSQGLLEAIRSDAVMVS